MTTRAAAMEYEAEHLTTWGGKPFAVHNPFSKPLEELPFIYGFNNGGAPDWLYAALIAADGVVLGGHVCSAEGYMPHDLGCVEGARPDRHETFRKHYPDGYRMTFVGSRDIATHAGLQAALAKNREAAPTLPESR